MTKGGQLLGGQSDQVWAALSALSSKEIALY